MTSRLLLSLVAALVTTACRRAEVDIPDPPPSATHMGVLIHDAEGRRVASTPLFAVTESLPPMDLVHDPSDDAIVEVVAYNELDPRADADLLLKSPLRRAGPTDPVLSSPADAWTRKLGDNTYVDLEDPASVELTSDALPPCPERLPANQTAFVDLSCFSATCPVLARQSDCRVKLDALECGLSVDEELDARGQLHGVCSERVDGPPEANLSITCGECDVDFYAGPFDALASVTTRAVVDVDDPWHSQVPPIIGYLAGIAVLADRVVVTSDDGPPRDIADCDTSRAARFNFLDLTTLAEIGTATAPPCIADLVSDDTAGGFIAVHGGPEPQLTRFDADGRALEQLFLFPGETPLPHRPMWMVQNGEEIVVLLPRVELSGDLRGFRLVTISRNPLRVTATSIEDDQPARPTCLAPLPGSAVAIGDVAMNGVFIYRTDGTGALDSLTPTKASLGGASQRVEFVSYNQTADRLVASVQAEPNVERRWGGTHVIPTSSGQPGIATPFAKTFERRTDASASLALPGNASRTLVMLNDLDGVAYVGMVDADGVRFLPGMVPVHPDGRPLGPASVMAWGETNVAYAVHPTSAHVTRIVVAR